MRPKVLIASSAAETVYTDFAVCLAALVGISASSLPAEIQITAAKGSIVPKNRNRIVATARGWGATHLLFLDTDMEFPPDALLRLYREAVENGRDIVACNYVERGSPFRSFAIGLDGKPVPNDAKGIVEASRMPTGLMLIRMGIFDVLKKPFFYLPIEADGDLNSEDYYFCDKVREAGYRIWLDADLSREVSHRGTAAVKWLPTGHGVEM